MILFECISAKIRRRAPKTVASAKIFGSRRRRRPIQICMAYYMQLLVHSCNYSFYIFIYVLKLIVLFLFLILVWRQITALRACLRNRRHTLRDEGLAVPLGGKCGPRLTYGRLQGATAYYSRGTYSTHFLWIVPVNRLITPRQ